MKQVIEKGSSGNRVVYTVRNQLEEHELIKQYFKTTPHIALYYEIGRLFNLSWLR
jgi:RNA-binding protein YhbY